MEKGVKKPRAGAAQPTDQSAARSVPVGARCFARKVPDPFFPGPLLPGIPHHDLQIARISIEPLDRQRNEPRVGVARLDLEAEYGAEQ